MVQESMKTWPQFLGAALYNPAEGSPDPAPTNPSLQLAGSGKDLGKFDRPFCRLQPDSDRSTRDHGHSTA